MCVCWCTHVFECELLSFDVCSVLLVCIDHMFECVRTKYVNICFRMSVWPIAWERKKSNGVSYFPFVFMSQKSFLIFFALLQSVCSSAHSNFKPIQSGIMGLLLYLSYLFVCLFFSLSFVDVYLFLAHFTHANTHTHTILAELFINFSNDNVRTHAHLHAPQNENQPMVISNKHTFKRNTHTYKRPAIRYFGLIYIIRFSERVSLNLDPVYWYG